VDWGGRKQFSGTCTTATSTRRGSVIAMSVWNDWRQLLSQSYGAIKLLNKGDLAPP
jgi:hypothetical protein